MGPYDGLVGPSVDRIGRNVRDALNTQVLLTSQGRLVVTADHVGVWDFTDPNQENDWLCECGKSTVLAWMTFSRLTPNSRGAPVSDRPKVRLPGPQGPST